MKEMLYKKWFLFTLIAKSPIFLKHTKSYAQHFIVLTNYYIYFFVCL